MDSKSRLNSSIEKCEKVSYSFNSIQGKYEYEKYFYFLFSRDFSNGYLVAEILSWYYPQDLQMHSYANGASISTKIGNWQQLERIFSKHELDIPREVVEGAMHCKPGAAASLITILYTLLTHRM